jgi:prevent-host-death family protein
MKIASVAEVKTRLSAYLKASEGGPVVVTRNGRPVAVLVGVQNEEEVEALVMGYSPRLRAILDASRQQIAEGRGSQHEAFWSEAEGPKPPKGRAKGTRKKA